MRIDGLKRGKCDGSNALGQIRSVEVKRLRQQDERYRLFAMRQYAPCRLPFDLTILSLSISFDRFSEGWREDSFTPQ